MIRKGGSMNNNHHNEVHTEKFFAGRRTYYVDVKKTSTGDKYLKITEKRKEEGRVDRFSVFIYEEDMSKFFNALDGCKDHFDLSKSFVPESQDDGEALEE